MSAAAPAAPRLEVDGAYRLKIDGKAAQCRPHVARTLKILLDHYSELVTYDDLLHELNITQQTLRLYLTYARAHATVAGLQIRSVRNEGVVIEPIA